MEEKRLKELIEQTFDRLSCPFRSLGFYNEIYQAMLKAFEMGQQNQITPVEGTRLPSLDTQSQTEASIILIHSQNPMGMQTKHKYMELQELGAEEQNVWAAWVDETSDGERHT